MGEMMDAVNTLEGRITDAAREGDVLACDIMHNQIATLEAAMQILIELPPKV